MLTQCWANALFLLQDRGSQAIPGEVGQIQIAQRLGNAVSCASSWFDAGTASGDGGPALYQRRM